MKPMTCLFRLMLIVYIFISSIILLRSNNKGDLTLSTWGKNTKKFLLGLTDCECV